jgi:hypothetical protein
VVKRVGAKVHVFGRENPIVHESKGKNLFVRCSAVRLSNGADIVSGIA